MNRNSLYLIQRFASFVTDVFVVDLVYALFLVIIGAVFSTNNTVQSAIKSFYSISVNPNIAPSNVILLELGISFFIVYGIYFWIMLLVWDKTVGMFLSGIRIVKSDSVGNPVEITNLQKFSRGFFCGLLSFFFIFTIPLPFGQFNRSIVDYIAEVYVLSMPIGKVRKIYVWAVSIIGISLLILTSLI